MKKIIILCLMLFFMVGRIMAQEDSLSARLVKLACVQWQTDSLASKTQNLQRIFKYIEEAAQNTADIILLPENVLAAGISNATYRDMAETIQDSVVTQIRQKAAQYQINVIFPMIEQAGTKIFNSAVVINRQGAVVGSYRKTHEPKAVIELTGVSLGDLFPVFELDFGKIGIMICYDIRFPEVIEILALNGAEIVFFPHLITVPSQFDWEVSLRSRAMDNCVYLAASATIAPKYKLPEGSLGKTAVIGKDGSVLANQADKPGILYKALDLSKQRITEGWGEFGRANWEKLYRQERRPEIYGRILEK